MKTTLILVLLFSTTLFASDEIREKAILQSLYQTIGIEEAPLEPTPVPTEKPLSKGELAVKAQLEENKKRLKEMAAEEKKKGATPEEGSLEDLKKKNKEWMAKLKKENKETMRALQEQIDETRREWKEKQRVFYKKIKEYKANLVNFESSHPLSASELKLGSLTKELKAEHMLIPSSLSLKIKDQGQRPTCAAFAGTRALETLLKAKGQEQRLSEQYLYWASKPECQFVPCSAKGSWPASAFEKSRGSSKADIPSEADCPYNANPLAQNETQIPLVSGCQLGKAKVKNFSYLKNLDEVVEALKNSWPVIAGFTLTPNFYRNEGLVREENSLVGEKMDAHAAGHAMLLVGYIKLPEKEAAKEGKICLITANSWGEGFGKGGYTCLTEKWVLAHRIPNAFIALKDVEL